MNIPFVSFEKMHNEIKVEVLAKMQEIYEKNWFIQGPEVTAFEEEFAAYCGTKVLCRMWKWSGCIVSCIEGIWNQRRRRGNRTFQYIYRNGFGSIVYWGNTSFCRTGRKLF